MADIVLLDGNGVSSTYTGKETITIPTLDGGEQVFETQKVREHPTVDLNFSDGDTQEVTPSDGAVLDGVTISKPDALVSDNIASGVEIAGVVGSLSAITVKAIAERSVSGNLYDESVQFVDTYAFANCIGLEEVSFPMCSSVGTYAFAQCKGLKSVSIPRVSSAFNYVFNGCNALETATIGCNSNFYTVAYPYAFNGCTSLRNINFMYSGSSVDGKFAFNNQSGNNQFQFANCSSLESIHIIGKGTNIGGTDAIATTIPGYAFSGCTLLSDIKFTGKLGAFRTQQSNISHYYEIGAYAFNSCGNLSYLSLSFSGGAGIGIGSYAFAYCSKLQDLWLNFESFPSSGSTWAWLGASAFYGTPIASSGLTGKFGSIHITKNAYSYLRIASGWAAYAARMVSY